MNFKTIFYIGNRLILLTDKIAAMYLYRKPNGKFCLSLEDVVSKQSNEYPSGQLWLDIINDEKVALRLLDGTLFRNALISEIKYVDSNGAVQNYTSLAAFLTATDGFFAENSSEVERLESTFTRPTNNTDYAAYDTVNPLAANATAQEFTGDAAFYPGGGAMITFAKIEAPAKFAGSTISIFPYNDTPSVVYNDNAPFVLDAANGSKRICQIDVEMGAVINGSSVVVGQVAPFINYKLAAGVKKLKYQLRVNNAIVAPENAGAFKVYLTISKQK